MPISLANGALAIPDTSAPVAELGLSEDRLAKMPKFFEPYIENKKLPHMALLLSRGGEIAHISTQGVMDWETNRPITTDTIFRIYSMTKPITCVAAMMLFEEGGIRLEHEVHRYLPEFSDIKVWDGGTADAPELKAPDRPVTIRDLFTHTSGITYGFLMQHPVDAIYRREKIGAVSDTIRETARKIAAAPLVFSPGERWNYGHSIDVLGAIVEEVSGQTFDTFLRDRIFNQLGMVDTDFFVPEDKRDRFPACYAKDAATGETVLYDPGGDGTRLYASQPVQLNPGGGLVSTLDDYHRFARMLLNGGALDGNRLLSPKTIEYMTENHLPGGKTILSMGDETFSEARMEGNGFGLLGSVMIDPIEAGQPGSMGSFAWGGLASTYFWVDPLEELIGIQMTQLIPSSTYPIRPQFQQLAYASIVA
ncbi:MAG: serine hydrolase domain-containing protein [Pseudomonadota bacterium]